MYQTIQWDVQDHIGVLTLNRPERLNAIDNVMRAELEAVLRGAENDDAVFGIVSTNPAFILNGAGFRNGAKVPVALAGRVPVLVTGPVSKGDRLVSSSLPGVAQVAQRPDPYAVIGRSLVNCDDPGVRSIEAVVGVK